MKTAAPKTEIITLYEFVVAVDPTGIAASIRKYAVKFTGKNYLPQMVTHELRQQGFSVGLHERVKADEIMQVRRVRMYDRPDEVGRNVYFLEGDRAKAQKAAMDSLNETVERMKKDVDGMHAAWTEKKMRPPRQ